MLHILRSQSQMKKTFSHSLGLCLQTSKISYQLPVQDSYMEIRNVQSEFFWTGSQETFLRTTIANDLKIKPSGSPATMNIKVLGGQGQ